jgi:two-component sensor histidine kinase/CheY-like chemotaxis protein
MSLEEFASVVGGRVQALARAHDQITVDNWGPAPLRTLFAAETQAYLNEKADRIALEGPDVLLEPRAFSTLALVVHELLTNSAKYGALCDSVGKVRVKWDLESSGKLAIDWAEEGGPPVQAPTRRGFGTTIIERSIPFDLKGDVDIKYNIEGLRARFEIPPTYVKPGTSETRAKAQAVSQAGASVDAGDVKIEGAALIIEDNMIIALDAEATLQRLGAHPVETAPNVSEALRLIEMRPPALAIVDVNLGQESSFPVADVLTARGIPFVFATGYGKNTDFPERFRHVPVVTKPYAADSLFVKIAEALNAENRAE